MRVRPCFLAHRLYRRIHFFWILETWNDALSQITTNQRFPARVAPRSKWLRNARPGRVGIPVAAPDIDCPVAYPQRAVDDEGPWISLLKASPCRNALRISLPREGAQTRHFQRREPTLVLVDDLHIVAFGEAVYESIESRFFWA